MVAACDENRVIARHSFCFIFVLICHIRVLSDVV
jgi:hypothetical protein